MPVSTNPSHYQSYDNAINGLSPLNGITSNGVVIVSPPNTQQQSSGVSSNNNSNGNYTNNNNLKDKHHHQQQQSTLSVRPTSPLPSDYSTLNGGLTQLTSPLTPRTPIMNGNLINTGTLNRNASKNRLTVNHVNSSSSGLLSTTLTSPTANGPSFNSTKQTVLDITRSGSGLTPPGLVTSSSSTTATGQAARPLRNGGLNISRISGPGLSQQIPGSPHGPGCPGDPGSPIGLLSPTGYTRVNQQSASDIVFNSNGISEMLSSLALMCLLSLLMAFLALFFLQRTGPIITIPEDLKPNELPLSPGTNSPLTKDKSTVNVFSQSRIVVNTREYVRVFQISVSLSTLTISLNLCCLFVCCIQFLSAVKLLKTPQGTKRTQQFLKKTSHVRITAIGAFLLSIPIFFTGVILFTFINFDETPALITSIIIGIGIVFCGLASVQNVYLWQAEKTKASKEMTESRLTQLQGSALLQPMELSTLV